MLTTFRTGRLGTKAAVVIVAVIGGIATMYTRGPIAMLAEGPVGQAHLFQAFLAILLLTALPVAAEATKLRAGVSIGSGIGGLPGIEIESVNLHERGPGRVSPHFVHGRLINLISGQVSIKYGLMGPNHAVVTACSTGAHSSAAIHRPVLRARVETPLSIPSSAPI